MLNISVELTKNPKQKPTDETKLGFGHIFTDHMFVMNYDAGMGWHDPRIIPYQSLQLDPAAMCLHYSQEVFEGMKAYRTADGTIQLFRPDENFKRLNVSNQRVCIPPIDVDDCIQAVKELVVVDQDWVPHTDGTSLYIRPFIIATDAHVGVQAGNHYLFIIILSPVGAYYPTGMDPVSIYVESKYARTVKGGTGVAKTGGNYAASLIAQEEAHEQGYTQVLWLDGATHQYVEEVGTMNVFFVIGDEVVTPALEGSILSGITRKSSVQILKDWGYKVSERRLPIAEVVEAYQNGNLKEVFGTGTAAVISPVGKLKVGDLVMDINGGKIGPITQRLYDELTGIQWGKIADRFGWIQKVTQ
ncbi:MAG TPA: branched-chain amino acid aminotransferase [Firmicutes bacterium]|nr:branched-chain amino acid aminotransferase [Bacillota bacterium]